MSKKTFRRELIVLINKHSKENGSNTPDYILANYLIECLNNFDRTIKLRTEWYGEKLIEQKIIESRNEFEKEIDEFNKHEHVFDSDGGSCRTCGKTVVDLLEETTHFPDEKRGYPSRRNAELP
jgi:hypothetical protein